MTRSYGHVHDKSCYWDLNQCGWACPAPAAAPSAASSTSPSQDDPGHRSAAEAGEGTRSVPSS